MEFVNNSYQASIKIALFETLYRRNADHHNDIGERKLSVPKMIRDDR